MSKSDKINWPDHLLNFLAVIIGVSLAFYVNSAAEERKLNDERRLIVNSFLEELSRDRLIYEEYQIEENQKRIQFLDRAINQIVSKDLDSLAYFVRKGVPFNNYAPQAITFNSTSSTGKLDLLSDYELRIQVAGFYSVTVKEADFRGLGQVDFYKNNLMPWLIKHTNFIDQNASVLIDQEFLNMLIIYKDLINNKVNQYEELVDSSKKLEAKLESLKSNL